MTFAVRVHVTVGSPATVAVGYFQVFSHGFGYRKRPPSTLLAKRGYCKDGAGPFGPNGGQRGEGDN